MCFAPQRHALFEHRNSQKCCEPALLWTFHFAMCFARATAVSTFCRAYRTEVLQTWGAFCILTAEGASRHSRFHFFRHLTVQKCSDAEEFCTLRLRNAFRATVACTNFWSLIRPDGSARRFSEPAFQPPARQNIGRNIVFRDFSTFFYTLIFFFFLPSLLWLSSLTLPASAASSVHTVGSLTSKRPSSVRKVWPLTRFPGISLQGSRAWQFCRASMSNSPRYRGALSLASAPANRFRLGSSQQSDRGSTWMSNF